MKSNNKMNVSKGFEDLFALTVEEQIEQDAQMFSFKLLSEVQQICEREKVKRNALAEKVGVSLPYLSQLFTGSKKINPNMVAKMQLALDFEFEIKAKMNHDDYADFVGQQAEHLCQLNKPLSAKAYTILVAKKPSYNNTPEIPHQENDILEKYG